MNFPRIAALAMAVVVPQAAQAEGPILIEGARVFDGTGSPARIANVLIEGDRIVAVGASIVVPDGAVRIDAKGKTLIPGLHDLHTHLRAPGYDSVEDLGKAYAGYLLSGVTTVVDFSVSGEMIAPIRAIANQPGGLWAPNLKQAVRFSVPGGHGTEYGWGDFFTMQVTTARAAHLQMPVALSYDPDLIKVFNDGWRYDRDPDLMSMNQATLAALVDDAHAAGKAVITHTVTLDGAKIASAARVDSVGHGVGDALIDDQLIERMRESGTGYIATLVVYEPQQTRSFTDPEWAAFNPGEKAREDAARAMGEVPVEEYDSRRWKFMRENIGRLRRAGIPIGVGTDSGLGGVYHGPATIREIRWLSELGLSAAEALVAATRVSAEILGQEEDHGTIEPGKRADLVLIDGKPDKRIEDLWRVAQVWVSGREAPLAELRAMRNDPGQTPMPVIKMTGPIMSAAKGDGRTELDTLPVASTDSGIDHSHLIVIDGAHGDPAFLAAQMGSDPRPYVEWILPLTRGPIAVADARAFTGIEFTVKGAGDYSLRLESYDLQPEDWFLAPFRATAKGSTVRIPFAEFTNSGDAALDLAQLRALRIMLRGQAGGKASLELGDMRFY